MYVVFAIGLFNVQILVLSILVEEVNPSVLTKELQEEPVLTYKYKEIIRFSDFLLLFVILNMCTSD